ncbi:MAG: hypothetical protein ACRDJ9_24545, partial [Dehalococcoidia bacterium]
MPRSPRHHPHPSVVRSSPGNVAATTALLDEHPATLSANLVTFGRALRAAGFDVTAGRLIDAARSLSAVGPVSLEDTRVALRANLVSERGQIPLFDLLFDRYWRETDGESSLPVVMPEERQPPPEAGGEVRELVAAAPRPAHAAEGDN